ncbi:MAG TPA: hypothetical protein VH439_07160 [Gemmatimonadales bacterium]|jgi:hypothetical protein
MSERIRKLFPWMVLFGSIAVIELVVRFAFPFSLRRVLGVETVVFLGAGLAAGALARRSTQVGWRHALPWLLAASLGLAAVRTGLWFWGVSVARANLVIGLLAVGMACIWWIRRRVRRPEATG